MAGHDQPDPLAPSQLMDQRDGSTLDRPPPTDQTTVSKFIGIALKAIRLNRSSSLAVPTVPDGLVAAKPARVRTTSGQGVAIDGMTRVNLARVGLGISLEIKIARNRFSAYTRLL